MFSFNIDGIQFEVFISKHAYQRMNQRKVNKYAMFGSIITSAEDILDLRHGDEFCIIDEQLNIAIVCALYARGTDINVEVVTVFDNHHFIAKDGTKTIKIKDSDSIKPQNEEEAQ